MHPLLYGGSLGIQKSKEVLGGGGGSTVFSVNYLSKELFHLVSYFFSKLWDVRGDVLENKALATQA